MADLPDDDLQRDREDFLLGRGEHASKRPSERRQMDAAMRKLKGEDKPARSEHEMDEQYGTPERFRNERDAFDKLSERHREQRREDEQAEADKAAAEAARTRQARQQAGNISENELAQMQAFQNAQQAHQEEAQRLLQAEQWAKDNPGEVNASILDKISNERQRLEQQQAQIDQVQGAVQQGIARKQQARGRGELPEALDDPGEREALTEWLVEEQGFSRRQVEAEQDPSTIGRLYRAFEKAKDSERSNAKAAKLREESRRLARDIGTTYRSQDAPATVQESRERLKQTGSVRDALHVLSMKKAERNL